MRRTCHSTRIAGLLTPMPRPLAPCIALHTLRQRRTRAAVPQPRFVYVRARRRRPFITTRRAVRDFLGLLALHIAVVSSALAGPNHSGTLWLHSEPAFVYQPGMSVDCGELQLSSCASANPRFDGGGIHVVFLYASFDPMVNPFVQSVECRLRALGGAEIIDAGACAGEVGSSPTWPASEAVLSITLLPAADLRLFPVAWLAVRSEAVDVGMVAVLDLESERARFRSPDGQIDPVLDRGAIGINQAGTAPCPEDSPEPGACCFPTGCVVRTRALCAYTFFGSGTTCDLEGCPPRSRGACCLPTGSCENVTVGECAERDGHFSDVEEGCDLIDCSQLYGACCLPNGDCQYITEVECGQRIGNWVSFSACEPNPCSEAVGVCCVSSDCRVVSFTECVGLGGYFASFAQSCDENPCCCPAVNAASWGRVKSRYR